VTVLNLKMIAVALAVVNSNFKKAADKVDF